MSKKKEPRRFEIPLDKFNSVIGIDPGYANLGLCRIKNLKSAPEYETLELDKIKDRNQRYRTIVKRMHSLLGGCDGIPLVVIEGYAYGFGSKSQQLVDLAGVGEILRYAVWRKYGYSPLDVPPTSLKKYITGKGNVKKDKILLALYKKFKIEFDTSHEGEAYALASIGKEIISGNGAVKKLLNATFVTSQL